MLSLMIL